MLDYVRCRWPHNGQFVEGPVLAESGSNITLQVNGTANRVVVNKSFNVTIQRKTAAYLRDHANRRQRHYAAERAWADAAGRVGPMPEWREFAAE